MALDDAQPSAVTDEDEDCGQIQDPSRVYFQPQETNNTQPIGCNSIQEHLHLICTKFPTESQYQR